MCSINDDEKCENLGPVEKQSFNENTTCRSCPQKGCVVLRKKDVYCKNCFLYMVNHKFRAALGKTKMMKPQDRVLVAYSGSQSSVALIHLLHTGVLEKQYKKLMFVIFILFIDEGPIFDIAFEEREKIVNNVKENLSCYNFPVLICSLGESLSDSPVLESPIKKNEKYDKQLIDMFQNLKSMSSKEDLLNLLRLKLVLKAAKTLNCNKVFTAEVGTDLAIKLLGRFCLGRGDQASFETGFCDSRDPQAVILRPLRDFTKKEIVFYNKFQSIQEISVPSLTAKLPATASIQKLTEKFVTDLQEGFPSTVYTIFRTAEKLSAKPTDIENNKNFCVLCEDSIRTQKSRNDYTAVDAANFSRSVSRIKTSNCMVETKRNCCGSCLGSKETEINSLELEKFLCYGCNSLVRDMKDTNLLPNNIIQTAILRRNSELIMEQISDFLFENTSEQ